MKCYAERHVLQEVLEDTFCDICGKRVEHERRGNPTVIRDVKIQYRHGRDALHASEIRTFDPDICSVCFREKIYPVIMEHMLPSSLPWINEFDERVKE